MKKNVTRVLLILAIVLALLIAAYFVLRAYRTGNLNNPESVAFDQAHNRFLVSSTGNGIIFSFSDKGKYTLLVKKGLDKPRGLKIGGSPAVLYVADGRKIRIVDLDKGKVTASIPVPGAKMLNDLDLDDQNLLYVTDTQANKIFLIDPVAKKVVANLTSPLLKAPNGIVFDRPRHDMLIVNFMPAEGGFSTNPLLTLNTLSREFGTYLPEILEPNTAKQLDGITLDKETGSIYFSSWSDQAIYRVPPEQNRYETFQTDLVSPADLLFHNGELLVPLFEENKVERIKVQ